MRQITSIVSHHGADVRKLTLAEMKRIYQENHYRRLHKALGQPRSTHPKYPDIAYHVLIGTDGWEYIRDFNSLSYHASHWPTNKSSVAVCLTGNYDRDWLSPQMEKYYREAIADLRKKIPTIKHNYVHRQFPKARKSCPGLHITDEFVQRVFRESDPSRTPAVPTPPVTAKRQELENTVAIKHLTEGMGNLRELLNNLDKSIKSLT